MAESGKPTGQKKIRVLIVDDIPETRENLRKLLFFESDIEVVGAANSGEEGISMAGELKPDIVLMDINMPGIDGITASEAITQQVPFTQIIMMSVQGEADYLRRSMLAGAREFLIKPFSSDELISSIRRVYQLGASRREAIPVEAPPSRKAEERPPEELGKIVAVFSPKGGVGCSTVAINLAIALHRAEAKPVALVDASLQFGDVAVLLNLQANRSLADLAPHIDELDNDLLTHVAVEHSSGIRALLAPPRPEMADLIAPGVLSTILDELRKLYAYIIVDTPNSLGDSTLTVLDAADRVVLITTPDIPSIKNAKLFFEVTEALEYPLDKTVLILNKADRHANIRAEDIQSSIKHPVAAQIPLDERTATLAANQGVPFMVSAHNTPLAQAIMSLGRYLVSNLAETANGEETTAERAALGRIFG
ncbi:MAG: response regulator [Anaerolineae bacterium]